METQSVRPRELRRVRRVDAEGFGLSLVRLPEPSLLDPIFALAQDPTISTHMEWKPHSSLADTEAFFAFCESDVTSGRALHSAVLDMASGEVLGIASLVPSSVRPSEAEATRWLGRRHWSQGIGTRTLSLLFQLAFGHLAFDRVILRVAVDNVAAQRSIASLRVPRESVRPGELSIRGRPVDCIYFVMTRAMYFQDQRPVALRVIEESA